MMLALDSQCLLCFPHLGIKRQRNVVNEASVHTPVSVSVGYLLFIRTRSPVLWWTYVLYAGHSSVVPKLSPLSLLSSPSSCFHSFEQASWTSHGACCFLTSGIPSECDWDSQFGFYELLSPFGACMGVWGRSDYMPGIYL